ncbi:hypothetical protein BEN78_06360 [Xanthomonas citri pv. mangiferaeindicae]|nr:hypothetical protein BEN78_06360 [Xanthomonas citri pv. mangiferaeindicae]
MSDVVSLPSPDAPAAAIDVFDHLATGLAQLAPDGTWRRVNAVLAAWLDRSPDALVGTAAHREALTPVAAQLDQALAGFAGGATACTRSRSRSTGVRMGRARCS